ncbi:MAG: hypothetical protein IJE89_05615 [Bacilli bacterium]|nr:hypothetical protein [Bacilli bacterium]
MEELFSLGISEEDMKNILEQNSNLFNISSDLVKEKIDILKYVNCDQRHIKNIIVSNPEYLERESSDILKLIKYLKDNGFTLLNLLFDSNPYFLNYDVFEIRDYVNKRIDDGLELDDIVDEVENNPYIIDEV